MRAFLDEGLRENEVLDYKETLNTSVIETVAAMANTDGGIVLLGIAKNPTDPTRPGSPIGVTLREIDSLKDRCRSLLQPPFVPEIIPVRVPDMSEERYVVVVRASPERDPVPVVVRERGVLVRVGDSTRHADWHRLWQLFSREGPTDGVPLGYENVHPSTYLPPDGRPLLLIRAALTGRGSHRTSTIDSATKRALFSYVCECPAGALFAPSRAGLPWRAVTPMTGFQFTAKAMISDPGPRVGPGPVQLCFHVTSGRNTEPLILTDISFLPRGDVDAPTAESQWEPVDYRNLYAWLQGAVANVTDPRIFAALPQGAILWSARLYAHVIANMHPWFRFGSLSRIAAQDVRSCFFEHELTDWPGPAPDLYGWSAKIAKQWLGDFLNDAGCIDYEQALNALPDR